MLTFQLIGLAFAVMFLDSMITGNARTARRQAAFHPEIPRT